MSESDLASWLTERKCANAGLCKMDRKLFSYSLNEIINLGGGGGEPAANPKTAEEDLNFEKKHAPDEKALAKSKSERAAYLFPLPRVSVCVRWISSHTLAQIESASIGTVCVGAAIFLNPWCQSHPLATHSPTHPRQSASDYSAPTAAAALQKRKLFMQPGEQCARACVSRSLSRPHLDTADVY